MRAAWMCTIVLCGALTMFCTYTAIQGPTEWAPAGSQAGRPVFAVVFLFVTVGSMLQWQYDEIKKLLSKTTP